MTTAEGDEEGTLRNFLEAKNKLQSSSFLITGFGVSGFKSHFGDESPVIREIKGLTLLAGANSSGKSSFIQPLLLLKQTLDAMPQDLGPIYLGGPNVVFTNPSQLYSRRPGHVNDSFRITVGLGTDLKIELVYLSPNDTTINLKEMTYRQDKFTVTLCENQHVPDVPKDYALLIQNTNDHLEAMMLARKTKRPRQIREAMVVRNGCFLISSQIPDFVRSLPHPLEQLANQLRMLLHLSAYRGNPERAFPRSTITQRGSVGLFHNYTAGLIAQWAEREPDKMAQVHDAMRKLGIGWKADAQLRDATSIEVRVSRTAQSFRGGAHDLVSIADVGFGVSQCLPVVVSLVAAQSGQLVYIEQPEIHLHPGAQKGMADLIADSVRRGVRVIVETHSEVILTRLQWHIARNKDPLPADQVVAHWFQRRPRAGDTRIETATPGLDGSLGEWPVDFADVAAEVDHEYATAAWQRIQDQ